MGNRARQPGSTKLVRPLIFFSFHRNLGFWLDRVLAFAQYNGDALRCIFALDQGEAGTRGTARLAVLAELALALALAY